MRAAIVCVDDDLGILSSLVRQLKRSFGQNYSVELASSSEDAVTLCAELVAEGQNIALIISDQRMPGMKGDALLIYLHTLYPKTLKIMLTGEADANSVGNVVNAAALYRYIRKPWDEADLILTVTEALRRFQQEQQLTEQNALLKKINAKLENSLSLLLATLEATADGILVLDMHGEVVSFNQRFVKVWKLLEGLPICQTNNVTKILLEQISESDRSKFQDLFTQIDVEDHNFLSLKDGSIIEYYSQPYHLEGEVVGRVLSFRDVTQEKQTEAMMRHQALHDALTNLPNRIVFNQKLAAALDTMTVDSKLIAVMFLDLDRFKQINDSLGHAIGDRLLQSVVHRLTKCLRDIDLIARWGGDEFVLLLPNVHRLEDVSEIAQRLIEIVQPKFFLEGHCLSVTTSIGIAVYPYHGLDSSTLIKNADSALYQAKHNGRNNYQHYSTNLIASN